VTEAARIEANIGDSVHEVEMLKSPRCIKSHLALQLLPEQLWTVRPKVNNLALIQAGKAHIVRMIINVHFRFTDRIDMSVPRFSLLNHLTNFRGTWYERCAIGDHLDVYFLISCSK
jgi:hypothetical protein